MAQSCDDLVSWAANARAALAALLDTTDDRLCRTHATLARDRLFDDADDGPPALAGTSPLSPR